jgi:pimeloyl-ACP methyl ester carboxylesterase
MRELLICTLLLTGCLRPLDRTLALHTMPITAEGRLATKQVPGPREPAEPRMAHYNAERAHAAWIARTFRESGKHTLLLYLHGGLVSLRASAAESQKLMPRMERDGYFPVFVNWDTGFMKSYGGHLVRKPNGYPGKGAAPLLAPFRLVLDLVEGVALIPRSWGAAGINAVQSNFLWHKKRDPVLLAGVEPCDGTRKLLCRDGGAPTRANLGWRSVQWVLQSPFKWVTTPVVYAGGGAAWNDMLRRTRIIFERDTEFVRSRPTSASEPEGALSLLLQELVDRCDEAQPLRLMIVAHSMGTIVANAVLERYLKNPRVEVEKIVYLGAAANISDSLQAVVPYLQAHAGARFFNVMLHPLAEDRERSGWGFAPDGSLLAWVDGMYEHPHSFLERTFGRWSNVKPALHLVPNDVRPRMHLHVLGFGNGPEKHGQLNDTHWLFWRDEFLLGKPDQAISEDPLRR